jgi:hypothetical protein
MSETAAMVFFIKKQNIRLCVITRIGPPCAWIRALSAPPAETEFALHFCTLMEDCVEHSSFCSADAPLLQLLVIGLIKLLGGSIVFPIFS